MSSTLPDPRLRPAQDVTIRPLAVSNRSELAEAFSRLGEETRRRRFSTAATELGERELDRLVTIDHHRHEALAAFARGTGRIVGVARYIALDDDPQTAEVAVTVDDEWRHVGIGRRLTHELLGHARAEGFTRVLAYVNAENRPVIEWITRSGGFARVDDGDATLFSIPLNLLEERRTA